MQRIIKNNEVVDETWHLLPKDFNIDEISNCDDLHRPVAAVARTQPHAHGPRWRPGRVAGRR